MDPERPTPTRIVHTTNGDLVVHAVRRTCDCGREFWAWPPQRPDQRKLLNTGEQYKCAHCQAAQAAQGRQAGDTYQTRSKP